MTDDELRVRLAAIDPVRTGRSAEPVASPSAAEIGGLVAQTVDRAAAQDRSGRTRWRRPAVLGAAAAVVLVAAVAGGVVSSADRDSGGQPRDESVLDLSLPPTDTMASCLPFDVALLRDMPVAFGGSVTELRTDSVTIDVDRWYTGGSADLVTVSVPDTRTSVALDGVEFFEGQRYLLTATDGRVNGCGFSGPATPELEKAFAEAFSG